MAVKKRSSKRRGVQSSLEVATAAARKLAEQPAEVLNGGAAEEHSRLRHTLSSLHALSVKLHRPGRYERAVRQLVTGEAPRASQQRQPEGGGITLDQIWGQLSTLSLPVLREAKRSLGDISKQIGAERGAARGSREGSGSDEGDLDAEEGRAAGGRGSASQRKKKGPIFAAAAFDGNDDGLDAELAAIDGRLARKYRNVVAAADARGRQHYHDSEGAASQKARKGDAWRYAFGRGNDDDDEHSEDSDDPDAFLPHEARRRKRVMGDEDADAEEEHTEDEEVDEESEVVTAADKARLRAMLRREGKRGGASPADHDDIDGDDEEEDLDAAPDGLLDGDEEDDDDGDDEGRAAMAELYGDGADSAAFMDDDEEEEEEEEEEDDDFGGDMASREGSEEAKGEGEGEEEEEEEDDPSLTAFERQERRRRREVQRLEEARLFGEDWAMKGEVSAAKRPRDSLIDQVVDFDHAMRPVPVVTENFTASIEERIKKRITDGFFDDVERRQKRSSADDLVTTRKDAALESEKSKLSLMDLYEKDYLDKAKAAEAAATGGAGGPEAAEPLTEIEKDELKAIQMWKRLSHHLDALSNFFFTPKPAKADLDARVRAVTGAGPAIAMENAGSAAVSREAAVAPQDLYRPKDNKRMAGVSVAELDPREKRAVRRAKKESGAATKERRQAHFNKLMSAKKKSAGAGAVGA